MTRPLRVGMLVFPGVTQLDVTGPFEVFARLPDTVVHLIGATAAPVRSAPGGLQLTPTTAMRDAPPLDLVMVPGGEGVGALMEDAPTLDFLRRQAEAAGHVTSVCTGALVLGAAGLLEGYRATTHWLSLDLLERFGAIPVEERVVIDRNRVTGAGVTAGVDFALAVAAELFGEGVACEIQLMMEYDPAPPFRSGSPKTADAELVRAVRERQAARQQRRREIVERARDALR